MFIEFLTWVIEVLVVFVIPLVASLRVLGSSTADSVVQKRWLIHWVLVVVANFTLYPLLNFLDLGFVNTVFRLAFAFGLLFIHKILGSKISDLNEQFLTTTSSLLGNVREVIKAQLVKFDLVKTQ